MLSNAQQNRVALALAAECLGKAGFDDVSLSEPQGTFPRAHITAARANDRFLIGVTSREEIGADREYNEAYNLVKTAKDLLDAIRLAERRNVILAFVALPSRKNEGKYAAYFGRLAWVGTRRNVPMLPADRQRYEQLADWTRDERLLSP